MQQSTFLNQMPLHVLIIDNHALIRVGLTALIQKIDAKAKVTQAANALRSINEKIHYDLIILDINMPDMDGLGLLRHIHASIAHKKTRTIVISNLVNPKIIQDAKTLGVSLFLSKDASIDTITRNIQSVLKKHDSINLNSGQISDSAHDKKQLNKRQLQILQYLSQGMSNKEISQTIFLSEGTIKNHITQIFNYLGVINRTQAIIEAERLNLTSKN